jgi:hypothetical protein
MPRYIDDSVPNVEPIRRRIAYLNDAGERIEENLDDVMVFSATGIVVEFPSSGQPIASLPSAEFVPVEITYFVKESGLLTKKIRLAAGGSTVIDSSECRMSRGTMERVPFSDWRQLAAGIGNLPSNTAIALGCMRPDFPEKVYLTTKDSPDCSRPGFAARIGDNIIYAPEQPAFALVDFDTKGMPPAVKAKIDELGGFLPALYSICPELRETAHISRRSTSAGIINDVTGEKREGGWHVFVLLADGTEAERFLKLLHARAWLAGLGWFLVGDAGQLLERSIVDVAVWKPERLVFEADPILDPGFSQTPRPARLHEGGLLACPPDLDANDEAQFEKLLAVARTAAEPDAMVKRKVWEEARIGEIVAAGADRHKARRTVEQWSSGVLLPSATIEFEDPEIGCVPVATILANPERFDSETCYDPVAGRSYGRCNAKFFADNLVVHCFARGGGIFHLRHDAGTIEAAILAGAPAEAVNILCGLVSRADLDVTERKLLVKLAGKRSGVGERVAEASLKETAAKQNQAKAKQRRAQAAAQSTKVRLDQPLPDAEAGPVMIQWDSIMSHVKAAEPPMRDIEDCPVHIHCREIPSLHELSGAGSNAEEDKKSRLPAPKNYLLTKHDHLSLEIEIGDFVTFVRETDDGEEHVAPPGKFVQHYLRYARSEAPKAYAVMTMPLVLPDGTLLAENGLDRARKLVFRIDPALLKFIPKPEDCTPEAVKDAYIFLRDEWLVDVTADAEGKAILIASAMSILERALFPARPIYFVTAGLRGCGKTTILAMIIYAVTGVKPSARAWTSNVDERRKSLLAILSAGMPAVVWDNVPRGTAINCQYIEAASTTEVYQDRILGVTEDRFAPAYTTMFFTGNNIHPHEDQASRSLELSLDTDRPDPENREFKHPDPMGWTRDHRGQILGALYTILIGNPRRSGPQETRFKHWMALVGTAVEYAAELADERPADERTTPVVSFKAAFERTEANDDASANRGSLLEALHGLFPGGVKFDAGRVISRLKESGKCSEDNHVPEDACIVDLRHFCTSRRANAPFAYHAYRLQVLSAENFSETLLKTQQP